MRRRHFLKLASTTTAFTAIGGIGWLLQSCKKDKMDMGKSVSVLEGSFYTPLPIPAIVKNPSLTAKSTTASILNGKTTRVFGYHESILGPTIKMMNGENANITFQNSLSEETNIHWHGLLIPASMDGHPENIVQAGSSFNFNFQINQRAGTYWYHPHPHGKTSHQVFMGLAGMFIVNDAEEASLNLPDNDYEIPLVIQDKRIYSDYSLNYSPTSGEVMTGYFGQYVLVNGVYAPYSNVAKRFYRMRVLNGSTARIYNLALSDSASFYVIGADGGLLNTSESVNSLLLAPGERADILVNFSNYSLGTEIYLQSNTFSNGVVQGTQSFQIMKFTVSKSETTPFTVPATLSVINPIPQTSASKTRTFDIAGMDMGSMGNMGGMGNMGSMAGMHTINGKSYDINRIDEEVTAGSTEIWVFDNSMGDEIHPMHIHGVQFQVLDRTGGRNTLIATEKGWKDTVLVMPQEKVRVIMTFPQNKGKFVLHCHNLEHEDSGMMLNFKIS